MSTTDRLRQILSELSTNADLVDGSGLDALVDDIVSAQHIFLAGAGRSGIAARAFANRLMHLGLSVSVVGEVTSPHSAAGDLLIVASGSGETSSLVALATKAASAGVRIAVVTMDPESTIAGLASTVAVLPGASPKVNPGAKQLSSIQPMGSAFEQLMSLSYDAMVLELMDRLNETTDSMFPRHADLE